MKYLILISALTITSTSFASSTKKEKNKFMKCIVKSIDARRVDTQFFMQQIELLNSYSGSNASELTQKCQELKQQYSQRLKKSYDEAFDDLLAIENNSNNKKARGILVDIVRNDTVCKFVDVHASAALGVGYGLGIGVGRCKSNIGKSFITIIPTGSVHLGIGAFLMTGSNEIKISNIRRIADNQHISMGFIFAKGGDQFDADGQYYGVGLGFGFGGIGYLPLKVIPGRTNYKILVNKLEQKEESSLY